MLQPDPKLVLISIFLYAISKIIYRSPSISISICICILQFLSRFFSPAIDIQVCLIAHRVNILSGWQVPAVAAVSAAAALASMMCRLCLWLWGQSQAAVSL